MRREELVDLNAFLTVAEEQSFTRAAAKLGTSHTVSKVWDRKHLEVLSYFHAD
jgi:hypothetical protein